MLTVTNQSAFLSALDAFEERTTTLLREKVTRLVSEAMRRLLAKTPVNTGTAVMNYVATAGTPYSGPVKGPAPEPVEPTNDLPLGTERLRPAAEAHARATLAQVDFSDPYNVFWITNRSPHIGGLERGALPRTPYVPRSPQGMFGVTKEELASLLASGKI